MLSSFVLFGVLIAGIVLSAIVWMALLRWALRWAQVEYVTNRKLLWSYVGLFSLSIVGNCLVAFVPPFTDENSAFAALVLMVYLIGGVVFLLMKIFDARFWRIVQALLPTGIGHSLFFFAIEFLVISFIWEAFSPRTNSLAPTIVGEHCQTGCPICKQPSFFTPARKGYSNDPQMICEKFHVTDVLEIRNRARPGDKILAMKFFSPRRWDLVVFKFPGDPSENYVKRLVGLPGETIYIADGAVWANGQRLPLPDKIQGLEYLSELPGMPQAWGTKDRPAVLGDDEYFMLGDYSAQSSDARFWEKGAPGRNSYAVPESHIIGVVTHTYWPLQRWRVHR